MPTALPTLGANKEAFIKNPKYAECSLRYKHCFYGHSCRFLHTQTQTQTQQFNNAPFWCEAAESHYKSLSLSSPSWPTITRYILSCVYIPIPKPSRTGFSRWTIVYRPTTLPCLFFFFNFFIRSITKVIKRGQIFICKNRSWSSFNQPWNWIDMDMILLPIQRWNPHWDKSFLTNPGDMVDNKGKKWVWCFLAFQNIFARHILIQ